jgi:hypothetical protein
MSGSLVRAAGRRFRFWAGALITGGLSLGKAVAFVLAVVGGSVLVVFFFFVELPLPWALTIILTVLLVTYAEGSYRLWDKTEAALAEATGRLREINSREALLGFLKGGLEAAEPIADWIGRGLTGSEYRDASALVDEWASPIFRRLLQYDAKLARTFNDDGGEQFTSMRPGEALDRRRKQLREVMAELGKRGD